MEPTARRFTFRLQWRGQSGDYGGRIVEDDGEYKLQVWMRSPEDPNILLEVSGLDEEEALWPLFIKLCEFKGVTPVEYRTRTPDRVGPWLPFPGMEHASKPAKDEPQPREIDSPGF